MTNRKKGNRKSNRIVMADPQKTNRRLIEKQRNDAARRDEVAEVAL